MGNWLLLFALACLAYVVLPACQRAFTQWSYGWQRATVASTSSPVPAEDIVSMPTMPAELLRYITSWGDQWAREDAMERAKRLWFKHSNWELVYQELLMQDGQEIVKVNG